jgi:predicted dehydrogenase
MSDSPTTPTPLRIGTLGAARITPTALLKPATSVPGATVVAVAARDRARGEKFATKHGIATVHGSYEDLLADPDVDAVYNPTPNGLHGRWTIAALEAGKHVLCEKPFTANADEAEAVAAVAAKHPDLVVMEAFHYRYHPLVDRLLEVIASGDLGEVTRIETRMCIPLPSRKDIRYDPALAGGALMDVGCYAIHQLRTLAGAEPTVVSGVAKTIKAKDGGPPTIDRWAAAEMTFDDGRTGAIECALWSAKPLSLGAKVIGERGEVRVLNMTGPQYFHRVVVKTRDPRSGVRSKTTLKEKGDATYVYQLQAFVDAVRTGAPTLTPPSDSIATMRVVDACYRAAGLEPRQPSA